jgi:hypothetical protein
MPETMPLRIELFRLLADHGYAQPDAMHRYLTAMLGRPVERLRDLSAGETRRAIRALGEPR